jgi:hypothetical protein
MYVLGRRCAPDFLQAKLEQIGTEKLETGCANLVRLQIRGEAAAENVNPAREASRPSTLSFIHD